MAIFRVYDKSVDGKKYVSDIEHLNPAGAEREIELLVESGKYLESNKKHLIIRHFVDLIEVTQNSN